MPADTSSGWDWFAPVPPADAGAMPALPDAELARAFTRSFATPDGAAVFAHLAAITQRRALGPNAADSALRHLEGQRQLVAYIAHLVERGRSGR